MEDTLPASVAAICDLINLENTRIRSACLRINTDVIGILVDYMTHEVALKALLKICNSQRAKRSLSHFSDVLISRFCRSTEDAHLLTLYSILQSMDTIIESEKAVEKALHLAANERVDIASLIRILDRTTLNALQTGLNAQKKLQCRSRIPVRLYFSMYRNVALGLCQNSTAGPLSIILFAKKSVAPRLL